MLNEILMIPSRDFSPSFLVDTPDPYVTLRIPDSAEVFAETKAKKNNKNPVWNEVFIFHLESRDKYVLGKNTEALHVEIYQCPWSLSSSLSLSLSLCLSVCLSVCLSLSLSLSLTLTLTLTLTLSRVRI